MMINIDRLRTMTTGRKYFKGDIIYTAGDTSDGMFVVLLGSLKVQSANGDELATLTRGDFFGEAALFLGKPRSETVTAQTDVMLLEVEAGNVMTFFESEPEAALAIASVLCDRLERAGDIKMPKPVAKKIQVASQPAVPTVPKATVKQEDSATGKLFPEKHGSYELELNIEGNDIMMKRNFTCPQCGKSFQTWAVRASRLITLSTDPDGRVRYRGVEPLYFDVISCPGCWFSATVEMFPDAYKKMRVVEDRLRPLVAGQKIGTGLDMDTNSIFAAHYLAIECAGICYTGAGILTGRLWQKLARLYADVGDAVMETQAVEHAYKYFMDTYEKTNLLPKQAATLLMAIAELAIKKGDLKTARNFMFKVKTDKEASPVVKRHADDRIEEIQQMLGEPNG